MKRSIKASKFETKVCLVDMYGEVVCELQPDGGFYVLPKNEVPSILMAVGDEYHVEEIEFEID